MKFNPAIEIERSQSLGEYSGVNAPICDSATYAFMDMAAMAEVFEREVEGRFLYSRHSSPTNKLLATALARMEAGEAAQVMASGMAAISTSLLQICSSGDEIVSSRTIYGGSYALLSNLLPRFGITTRFVDFSDEDAIKSAVTRKTRVLFCEAMNNPLLEIADIPAVSRLAHDCGARLVVDNTFSPLIISPLRLGADVVVHSMTKFINGTNDCVAGCVISSRDFIARLNDINSGASMLLGPVLDSIRASSILKNLHSLHVRMARHSENALYLATQLQNAGLTVRYPGLPDHPQHELFSRLMNRGFGFGGIVTVDVGDKKKAERLMSRMQEEKVGYLAVSLGYFKTLFSSPGRSTASEIPEEERHRMEIGDGLVRFSVGLDNDMPRTWETIRRIFKEIGIATERSKVAVGAHGVISQSSK